MARDEQLCNCTGRDGNRATGRWRERAARNGQRVTAAHLVQRQTGEAGHAAGGAGGERAAQHAAAGIIGDRNRLVTSEAGDYIALAVLGRDGKTEATPAVTDEAGWVVMSSCVAVPGVTEIALLVADVSVSLVTANV